MSRLGTTADNDVESFRPCTARSAAVTAFTAIGTFCIDSERRCAVTTISLRVDDVTERDRRDGATPLRIDAEGPDRGERRDRGGSGRARPERLHVVIGCGPQPRHYTEWDSAHALHARSRHERV